MKRMDRDKRRPSMAEFVSLFHHMVQLSVPVSPHFADPAWFVEKEGS